MAQDISRRSLILRSAGLFAPHGDMPQRSSVAHRNKEASRSLRRCEPHRGHADACRR